MPTDKNIYSSTTPTSLTVSGLATLANSTSATSATIDNSATGYPEYRFDVTVTTASGAVATGIVEVWVKGSIDNTDFDDDTCDWFVGSIPLAAAGAQTRIKTFGVASSFGGWTPPFLKIRLRNATGAALTAGTVTYIGITSGSV